MEVEETTEIVKSNEWDGYRNYTSKLDQELDMQSTDSGIIFNIAAVSSYYSNHYSGIREDANTFEGTLD